MKHVRSAAMAAALCSIAASAAVADPTFAPGQTYYAIGVPVCQAPKHVGEARCFALRRVVVDQNTPGAFAFRPAGGATADGTIGPAGGLTPADFATAYSLKTAGGAGQTVGIVDAYNDPKINNDLQRFDEKYDLKPCSTSNGCFEVVGQTGSTTVLPANDTSGWSGEESLDVETVHSICRSCKIILVEANSASGADLAASVKEAITLGATVVSNSYGGLESGASSKIQAAYHHPGVVITASTGDDGYYDFDELKSRDEPEFPASSPDVVAVGGTSLYLGETGGRQYETVWNDDGVKDFNQYLYGKPLGATGGGCSTRFTAQSWQQSVSGWSNTGCGTMRLAADVSADADYLTGFDIFDSYDCEGHCPGPSWGTYGGTSLAAPLIAGVFALAGGANGVKYPAETLYSNIGEMYDVTVGGNGWCDGESAAECGNPNTLGHGIVDCDYTAEGVREPVGACDALPGYDGPSGVGTPNGLTAFAPKSRR